MLKKDDIESKANDLLKQFSINKPPIPIVDIVLGMGLGIEEDEFGESVSGFIVSKSNKNVIGVNSSESEVRKRFTIAHELGHFLLHSNKKDFIFISKVHYRNDLSSTGELRKEREANSFAASLLMPEELIKKEIQRIEKRSKKELSIEELSDQLAKKFNVSQVAMTYRLTNLNYIL